MAKNRVPRRFLENGISGKLPVLTFPARKLPKCDLRHFAGLLRTWPHGHICKTLPAGQLGDGLVQPGGKAG